MHTDRLKRLNRAIQASDFLRSAFPGYEQRSARTAAASRQDVVRAVPLAPLTSAARLAARPIAHEERAPQLLTLPQEGLRQLPLLLQPSSDLFAYLLDSHLSYSAISTYTVRISECHSQGKPVFRPNVRRLTP